MKQKKTDKGRKLTDLKSKLKRYSGEHDCPTSIEPALTERVAVASSREKSSTDALKNEAQHVGSEPNCRKKTCHTGKEHLKAGPSLEPRMCQDSTADRVQSQTNQIWRKHEHCELADVCGERIRLRRKRQRQE